MLRPLARVIVGRKPSSAPEVLANVPRSNKGKPVKFPGDSLWSRDRQDERAGEDYEMTDNHLKVHIISDFGSERWGSVSTETTAVGHSISNV